MVIPGGGNAGMGAAIATRAAGLSVGFALKHAVTTSWLASMVYGFPTVSAEHVVTN